MKNKLLVRAIFVFFMQGYFMTHAQSFDENNNIFLNIELAMYQEHKESLEWILTFDKGGCIPIKYLEKPEFKAIRENKVILDFITLCHALSLGGITPNFSFVYYPVAARALLEMNKGSIMMAGFTMWAEESDSPSLYASIPVVEKGKFEKIFYTAAHKKDLYSELSLEQFKQFYVVSNPLWKNDWSLLSCLGFHIEKTLSYQQMYPMVNSNKADFLLTLLATNDESYHRNLYGVKLVPLSGFKVRFNDELKFYLSSAFPEAKNILKAINTGIVKLKNNGLLKTIQYYQGIDVDHIKDWKVLQC